MAGTVELFGIRLNRMHMREALDEVRRWIETPDGVCRYVVTPNVDHTVMYQENPALRDAYRDAALVLADGTPVVWASRLLGRSLPERVAGADLAPALFETWPRDRMLNVFFLGAGPGVAGRAAKNVQARWPWVRSVGTYCPPLGFENSEAINQSIVNRVNDSGADVLIIGLGAPKQELWIHKHREALQVSAALCVGAVIDFLAGEKKRAPRLMQQAGFEWLHRLVQEPERMFRRYARDAWLFPQLMWREFRSGDRSAT